MKVLDNKEQDDKLIAVRKDSKFSSLKSISELEAKYNGVTTILSTWFENYKGPGKIEVKGFYESKDALVILKKAMAEYDKSL